MTTALAATSEGASAIMCVGPVGLTAVMRELTPGYMN
jgi:hypothetical protein